MTESITVYKSDPFYLAFIWLGEKHGKTEMIRRLEDSMDCGSWLNHNIKKKGKDEPRAWQRA